MKKKYLGPASFYEQAAKIAVPSMLQMLLSSAMGILDTVMVSWIGEVTAVGTASQLEAICITITFGIMEGIGIFAAQFFGARDYHNMKRTFGLAAVLSGACGLVWLILVQLFGWQLVSFYIADPSVTKSALAYLAVVKYSYVPMCLSFAFSYLFRCMHKTSVPMWIGVGSMGCNAFFNYVLIFGKLGFPAMGVAGAAWGTVIADTVSLASYIVYAVREKVPFFGKPDEMFSLDWRFVKPIMKRTLPMIANETLFSFGSTMFIKAYGLLGKKVMDAYYVGNTVMNIFFSACNGVSVSGAMMMGARLGHGEVAEAKAEARYFLGIAGVLALGVSALIVLFAPGMVSFFDLQDPAVRDIAVGIVRISALRVSLRLFNVVVFSALRAGGDSRFLMFLDSGIMWLVGIPLAYLLIYGGLQDFTVVFLLVQAEQAVRLLIGLFRFHSDRWAVNLTGLVS